MSSESHSPTVSQGDRPKSLLVESIELSPSSRFMMDASGSFDIQDAAASIRSGSAAVMEMVVEETVESQDDPSSTRQPGSSVLGTLGNVASSLVRRFARVGSPSRK
jgi:hypothetical protein